MRRGALISGSLHGAFLLLAVFGADWFQKRDATPLSITEVEMISGSDLDAMLSTAPVVQSEGPAELSPPAPGEQLATPDSAPDAADESPAATELASVAPPSPRPTAPRPEEPVADIPPPPIDIPSEAPVPTIAEVPSPDPLPEQAPTPESPASTEPVMPLAAITPPSPSPRPLPSQSEPEPTPEPSPEPDPEPAPEPEKVEETVPQPRAPEAEQKETEEPEEIELAQAQPVAPESLAPREARLPVARPADRARAAPASSRPEPSSEQVAEEKPKTESAKPAAQKAEQTEKQQTAEAKPKAAEPAGGSSRPTAPLSAGEKDALRLGIKKYYTYNGDRSDPNLQVTIRVRLDKQGQIEGKPETIEARGGTEQSQAALGRAGRAALSYAANNGEFSKLPPDKHAAWGVLTVVFTTRDEVLF